MGCKTFDVACATANLRHENTRLVSRIDPNGWEEIIELPLEQQQDLLCTYQSVHRRKVYRSWATVPAIPPWIRHSGGGLEGKRMRWLAKSEPRDKMEDWFRNV